MEDTYQIGRAAILWLFPGAYSAEELREIEAYAQQSDDLCALHPDLIHLSAFVKWGVKEVQELRDVEDILLYREEKVYDLPMHVCYLSKLQTRKVNITDEAHGWFGALPLILNGVVDKFLMCQHFWSKVDIADKYGFHCQM